jgi:CTP:phosphocholine cytidylyltransferase-like protein
MSRKFLSFNKDKGLLTTTTFEDGRNVVKYEQDLQPYWDENARWRANSSELWAKGMKDEGKMTHIAFIPDIVILDMMQKHGVNFYAKEDAAKVKKLIETEYQNCKTTEKKLWIPS